MNRSDSDSHDEVCRLTSSMASGIATPADATRLSQLLRQQTSLQQMYLRFFDRLQAGPLKLADGTAEFTLDNGISMVLTGPAEIELRDQMHAWLHAGQVVFRVPPAAIGFTVETAEATIVDPGTEFGVRAAIEGPGPGTEVQVHKGEVLAATRSDHADTKPSINRLHGGQALQVSADSQGGVQPLPLWPERFIHELPDPSEHPDASLEGGRRTSPNNKPQHNAIHIPQALNGITLDSHLEEWDLSGLIVSRCEPPWGEFYNLRGAMMFDDKYLYVGAIVADPFPMRSSISPSLDRELYCGGGCVALRISTDRQLAWPVHARSSSSPLPRELLPEDRSDHLAFIVLWYYAAEQLPCLHLRYGMDYHGKLINSPGYRGAWQKHADGLGYTMESAVLWSLLSAADDPPRSGDTLAASWLVHWSDSHGRDCKGQLIDIVNTGEPGWIYRTRLRGAALFMESHLTPEVPIRNKSSSDQRHKPAGVSHGSPHTVENAPFGHTRTLARTACDAR